jgi:hypothetical protein
LRGGFAREGVMAMAGLPEKASFLTDRGPTRILFSSV